VLAIGDGALGFWGALRDVFPETREQRDWVHKVANILDALPKSIQPVAKKMLVQVRDAEDKDHALIAAKAFEAEFRAKWPKAADKLSGDLDELLAFSDFPAEHWIHLKTSTAIESTFSTVRLRTRVTKGSGSRAGRARHGLQAAQGRTGPLALRERTPSRGPRAGGRGLSKRGAGRVERGASGGRRVISGSGRSTTLDDSSVESVGVAQRAQAGACAESISPENYGTALDRRANGTSDADRVD